MNNKYNTVTANAVNFILIEYNRLSKNEQDILIKMFRWMNPVLNTVIYNKYELACYLADAWYKIYDKDLNYLTTENEWNNFYNFYSDTDGVNFGNEDENGYLD